MSMLKKLMISTALLVLPMPLVSKAFHDDLSLKDVNPDYFKAVDYLAHRGIIQGFHDGYFGALVPLTRIQAVTMIMRERRDIGVTQNNPGFTDIPKHSHHYSVVSKAVELGIIQGKIAKDGSKYFDPQATLTRAQMALLLTRAYSIPLDRRHIGFTDVPEGSIFQRQIDALAHAAGSIAPYDNKFKPTTKVTREEFSAYLARLLEWTINPMGLQFIPDDEYDLERPSTKWYTDQELLVKRNEMITLVNKARIDKGLSALQVDEQLMNLTTIKARGIAKYPNTEHAFQLVEGFYKDEYGVAPRGSFTEVTGGLSDAQTTLDVLLGDPIHRSVLLSSEPEKIGVGLAQDLDGSFEWVLFLWDIQ